ncbi:MAG: CDC27 family protein [Polyangiaceae bacterium]|nr:CDC27 family protein [Polyangiaceae bacterium]
MISASEPPALGWLLVVLALFTSATAAGSSEDRTRAAARQLAQDGAAAFDARDYERAQALLRRAHALFPAPTIAVLHARALIQLGRWVEAAERYESARRQSLDAAAPEAFRAAARDAEREVEELRPRIPLLTIRIVGAGTMRSNLTVELDGEVVPALLIGVRQPVDPGTRHIVLKQGDRVLGRKTVLVAERDEVLVSLDGSGAGSPAVEESTSQRTWAYVSLGVGLAGVTTGVVSGALMLNKKDRLDDQCSPSCPPSAQSDLDAFRSTRTVSFIGYGVGAVGLTAGAVLLLTAPGPTRAASSARLHADVGPGHVTLRGEF